MKKKVIYVDFVFNHKKVSHLRYSLLNIVSFFFKKLKKDVDTKSTLTYTNEKRKMFK